MNDVGVLVLHSTTRVQTLFIGRQVSSDIAVDFFVGNGRSGIGCSPEGVSAAAGIKQIIAATAINDIGKAVSFQRIVVSAASQVFNLHIPVTAGLTRVAVRCFQTDHYALGRAGIADRVRARTAMEGIAPCAARQEVVAQTTRQ